jgi:hypothetical protein
MHKIRDSKKGQMIFLSYRKKEGLRLWRVKGGNAW